MSTPILIILTRYGPRTGHPLAASSSLQAVTKRCRCGKLRDCGGWRPAASLHLLFGEYAPLSPENMLSFCISAFRYVLKHPQLLHFTFFLHLARLEWILSNCLL